MKQTYALARKIVILCVGIAIMLIGVVFLILPGPGLLISLLGLFVLSLEFPTAKQLLEWLKVRIEKFRKK